MRLINQNGLIKIRVVPDLKFGLRIRTGSGFSLATGFGISGTYRKSGYFYFKSKVKLKVEVLTRNLF